MNNPAAVPASALARFSFAGRPYEARLLKADKPGETDAIVFGAKLGAHGVPAYVIFACGERFEPARAGDQWWSARPGNGGLTPLAHAAIKAVSA